MAKTIVRNICVTIFLLCLLTGISVPADSARVPFTSEIRGVKGNGTIVFMSDIQSPLWFEKLAIRSDNNEEATQFMLNRIGEDTSVVALFLLGDMVALGSFGSYWDDLYDKTAAVRNAHIPVFAAFGNHEYKPFESKGKEHFFETFPYIKSDWYSKRIKNIGIIILNSNFSRIDEGGQKEQNRWYIETLKEFDRDSSVAVVIVGTHYPPYTNSKIIGPSEEVQEFFVEPFLQSKKAKVFLSGHAHTFEHFKNSGKDFFVIGGGGGLLHPLLQGKERRRKDIPAQTSERIFFHYLRTVLSPDSLSMRIMKLSPDRTRFDTLNILNVGIN